MQTFLVSCQGASGEYTVHVPATDHEQAMELARQQSHDAVQVVGVSSRPATAQARDVDPLARAGLLMSAVGIVVPILALGGIVCGCIANGRTHGRDGAGAIAVGLLAMVAQAVIIGGLVAG